MYLFTYAEPGRGERIRSCTQTPSLGLLSWLPLVIHHQTNCRFAQGIFHSLTNSLTHSLAHSLTRWVLPLRPQPYQRQRRPLRMVTALSLHAYRSHHAHWSSCVAGCDGAWSNALLNSAFTPHQASETSATDSDGVSSKRSRPDAKVSGNGVLVHVYACMHNQA